jgi:rSAM/selenodomain-associated transferase 1
MNDTRVVIFAKAPAAGFAKTRLIPVLGAEHTAQLAARMLNHAITSARDAQVGTVELCVTPDIDEAEWRHVDITNVAEITAQGTGNLGERLARAAGRVLAQHSAVIFMGTDCPSLDAQLLQAAARHLWHADTVLYPASDGGYALFGLRRSHERLFQDIEWSTSSVLQRTLDRIAEVGWSVHIGPTLHDIDDPADLVHLPASWR